MISGKLQLVMLAGVCVYFILLWMLLKRRSLNLKYTLLWIFSGCVMLFLGLFPWALTWISELLGIYAPTNALFALMFFCVIIILVSLTSIVSKLNQKCTKLAQTIAILEKQIRELEKINEEL